MVSASKEKFNTKKLLTGFFSLSILAHLSLSLVYISEQSEVKIAKSNIQEHKILIKLLQNKSKPQQIVQTEQSKFVDKPKDAEFLGKKRTSFDRQTRVANTGKFKSAGEGKRNAVDSKSIQRVIKKKIKSFKDIKLADLGAKPFDLYKEDRPQIKKLSRSKKGLKSGSTKTSGLGQRSDHLDDIPLGDFTKLNTQEFEFYGFYHRIREKLEQFWGMNIQEQATKISKQGRRIASNANLVTGLVITLNSKGDIVGINLKSTSGIKELDDAAVESFNQAGPFPNPPKGMIKNGIAVIDWGFVVNT